MNNITVSDAAVQAAMDAMEGNVPPIMLERAIYAAIPHLTLSSAPCSVEVGEIEELLTAEMNRQFGSEPYIVDGIDNFPNHDFLPVDDTQLGVEFAFEFLKPYLSQIVTKPVDVAEVLNSAALIVEGRSTAVNSEFIESLSHRRNYEVAEIVAEHDLKLGAAIRALSPAEPAHGEQWQDIATAPKDGTTVLLFATGWDAPSTGWTFGDDGWQECPYHHNGDPSYNPTHWMPLPEDPTE